MKHLHTGKVRDLYELDGGDLLIVARDDISAFDHVLEGPIPDKGRVLTKLSLWWFERLADLIPNHVVSAEPPPGSPPEWAGRTLVVRRLAMVPVECVARGHLTGSGYLEYRRTGAVCGVALPAGLAAGARLAEPIFTPTTKAPLGWHDEPLTHEQVGAMVTPQVADRLRAITLAIYRRGAALAAERGVIVADTKIELGWDEGGELVLGDEVLTPDSSRFWDGQTGRSFDKRYVRDWLVSPTAGWERSTGEAPPPLPAEVVERTRATYIEAYERLTGRRFG